MAETHPSHSRRPAALRDGNPSSGCRRSIIFALITSLGLWTSAPQISAQNADGRPQPAPASKPASPPRNSPPRNSLPQALPAVTPKQMAKARSLFAKGTKALRAHDSLGARKLFNEAHRLDPSEPRYLAAYDLATQQQVGEMLTNSTNEQKAGKNDDALNDLHRALQLDPGNPYVQEHLQSLAAAEMPAVAAASPLPTFSSGLVELAPSTAKATFHLQGRAAEVIPHIYAAYGVTALIDDSVPTQFISFDLDNASFQDAQSAIELMTGTFAVPLDPQRVLVAKNTPQNRKKFERLLLETVYLPGVTPKDMQEITNLVRNIFELRQVSARPNSGTISIRASEQTLRAINKTLAGLYQSHPEVVLDMRVYQINDSRMETLGVQFPQQFSVFNVTSELQSVISANQSLINQLIASGLVSPGNLAEIAAVLIGMGLASGSILSQPFALFGNGLTLTGLTLGTATANASLNTSHVRQIDHVQLRTGSQQTASLLIGSRYPVITASYSSTPGLGSVPGAGLGGFPGLGSLAGLTGGANQQSSPLATFPTVQYENLGLTFKAKTSILRSSEVQMGLDLKIDALGGASINGVPVINTRSFTGTVRIPDGKSALIISSLSRSESRALSGIPGLSELPGFSWTASTTTQRIVGNLVILITPHIVNAPDRSVASRMLELPPGSAVPR